MRISAPISITGLAAAMALAMTVFTAAVAQTTAKPGRLLTGVVKSAVIVETINYDTREIKVLDAAGNRFTVVADEAVPNLAAIKPRDRIVTEYIQSVAIVVLPKGAPELPQGAVGSISGEGEDPAITGMDTVMVRATVNSIDMDSRRVTLTDEDGNTSSFPVGDTARLELVDVGDEVRVRLTRAVAITVVTPDS